MLHPRGSGGPAVLGRTAPMGAAMDARSFRQHIVPASNRQGRLQRPTRMSLTVWALGAFLMLPPAMPSELSAQTMVRGTVFDSVTQHVLVHATVVATRMEAGVPGTMTTTETDGAGRFELKAPSPGTYVLSVEHPTLDSLTIPSPTATVQMTDNASSEVQLATASVAGRLRSVCPSGVGGDAHGAVIGVVSEVPGARPIAGATVVLQWSEWRVDTTTGKATGHTTTTSATTDAGGAFRYCGVPIGLGFRIQAQSGASNTGILEMQVSRAGVLPLVLGIPATVADRGIVAGAVVNAEGAQISGARVRSLTSNVVVSADARGRFAVPDVPAGSQQLEISAPGYYPEHVTLLLDAPASYEVRAALQRVTMLEAVRITARRGDGSPFHREFDDRYGHGGGRYLTAEDMSKRPFFRVSDALVMLPGMFTHVTSGGDRMLATKSSRGTSTLLGIQEVTRSTSQGGRAVMTGPPAPNFSSCGGVPAVFIDGSQASLEELDLIPPRSIYGIEVYREGDAVPARYTGSSTTNCGAIIVWTK
ncbi:MAG: hypothetical protein DMD35_04595 [Gemmatimonadetes bacterium]|nr:MAG: hypothetical protein DMD35_04595 [Gemmatimonadota bacterium]